MRSIHYCCHFPADCPLIKGDSATALLRYRRSLEAATALGDRAESALEIQGVAMATAGLGQHEDALRLAGAADAELESLAIDISGIVFWAALLERYLGAATDAVGMGAAEAARADGRRRGFEWAVRESLSPA
jgi:hypothetical protein